MSAEYEIVLQKGRRFPWSLGWHVNFTRYADEYDIFGISPDPDWWRPTRSWAERAIRRQIAKDRKWREVERITVRL